MSNSHFKKNSSYRPNCPTKQRKSYALQCTSSKCRRNKDKRDIEKGMEAFYLKYSKIIYICYKHTYYYSNNVLILFLYLKEQNICFDFNCPKLKTKLIINNTSINTFLSIHLTTNS